LIKANTRYLEFQSSQSADGVRRSGIATESCCLAFVAADLIVWLRSILFKGVSCRPYNVGSDADSTIAELARTVASVSQPALEVLIAKNPPSEKPPDRYVPSIERASRELNLISRIQLRQAIQKTMAWHSRMSVQWSDLKISELTNPQPKEWNMAQINTVKIGT
jgi:dTDP-D-glucose 4,6-dehydratase